MWTDLGREALHVLVVHNNLDAKKKLPFVGVFVEGIEQACEFHGAPKAESRM